MIAVAWRLIGFDVDGVPYALTRWLNLEQAECAYVDAITLYRQDPASIDFQSSQQATHLGMGGRAMDTESIQRVLDEVLDHVALMQMRLGRKLEWSLATGSVINGYATTVSFDGEIVSSFGRSLAESHQNALLILRDWVAHKQDIALSAAPANDVSEAR